ncbi:baculoviral IAP repeat-containing protein 7-like [Onthophagus taurus]|uniref:baculoviral IAP repeat-containing protein 7-like n=1 Tax=Onthophagus taurus TaxID=166361 RepID=UPI0039BDBE9B
MQRAEGIKSNQSIEMNTAVIPIESYSNRAGVPERYSPFRSDTLTSRLQTFKDWPKQLNQKPKDLAQAGFYYVGEGDKVTCFSCGVGLNDWEADDNPWSEHQRWSPNCPFLNLGGNKEFLQTYHTSKEHESKEQVPNNIQCVICCDRIRNILSLPCKHLSTCEECNDKLPNCPICKKEESYRIKIYIP